MRYAVEAQMGKVGVKQTLLPVRVPLAELAKLVRELASNRNSASRMVDKHFAAEAAKGSVGPRPKTQIVLEFSESLNHIVEDPRLMWPDAEFANDVAAVCRLFGFINLFPFSYSSYVEKHIL